MYCKYCGKSIDDDSIFCRNCGRKVGSNSNEKHVNSKAETTYTSNNEGETVIRNGERFTIRNGILYDEDGWDIGRVPNGYVPGWGDPL